MLFMEAFAMMNHGSNGSVAMVMVWRNIMESQASLVVRM